MAGSKSVCIMNLVGLPGAGKTTFCRAYAAYLARKNSTISLVAVSLDDMIPMEQQAAAAANPGTFKRWREHIAAAVESHIQKLNQEVGDSSQSEPTTQMESCDKDNLFYTQIDLSISNHERILLVIDDNSYLRSMRYPYYQIARRHGCGYCQFYLDVEPALAEQLNQRRDPAHQVDTAIIRAMANKLEPPDPLVNTWEKFSFRVLVSDGVDTNFDIVESIVELAFSNPESPVEERREEKERDRIACTASVVHQADKQLRALVSKKISACRASTDQLSKDDLRLLSTRLYEAKQEVLEDLRTGFTKLDASLVEGISSSRGQTLASNLSEALLEELSSQLAAKLTV